MKNIFPRLTRPITLLLMMLTGYEVNGQISDFQYTIANDIQINDKVMEFDLFILDSDPGDPFELSSIQAGILVNSGIYNGGTISLSIVSGTSQLNSSQQPTSVIWTQSQNAIKLTPKLPPGAGSGTIISQTAPGTRVCRLRITNTVAFTTSSTANLTFNFTTSPYPTKVSQYISGTNTDLACNSVNCFSNASNIILNSPPTVNPTATPGTVCAGGNVQLNAGASGGSGSYNYTWTSNPAGFNSSLANPTANPFVNTTYNVAVFDGVSTVNSQVSVNVNSLPATPTISASGPTTFCPGGSVTLTSSSGTTYLWSNGATTASINVTTAGSYSVRVTNSAGCQSAFINCYSSFLKCCARNSNHFSKWTDHILSWWQCNLNLKLQDQLIYGQTEQQHQV